MTATLKKNYLLKRMNHHSIALHCGNLLLKTMLVLARDLCRFQIQIVLGGQHTQNSRFYYCRLQIFSFSLKIDIFRSSDLLPFLLSYVDFLLRTSITGRKASLQNICCGGIDIRTLWGKKRKTPMDERRELHLTSSAQSSLSWRESTLTMELGGMK